ncbi:MAG TPA: hypothetical protein P5205_11660 [Candidatus Paceibacterota bacterium]|nr:hypothetical protein [Verrucomicrobiota bacterium]HSA11015.1 hypothetical protein [Candidatus Paceibacterota bacterium]
MTNESQQVQLIVEEVGSQLARGGAGCAPERGTPVPGALALPPGLAWLQSGAGGIPRISTSPPGDAENAVLIEQVAQGWQTRLLLVAARSGRVHVNGLPAPRFSLLKERDTLRLDGDSLVHVTVFNRPVIGPAPAASLGSECPVCRVRFAASIRCYICACGNPTHFEEGGDDCLQCALLRVRSGCPYCGRPMVLEPGYTYLPEGLHESL